MFDLSASEDPFNYHYKVMIQLLLLDIKIEFFINYIVQLLQPRMPEFGPRGPVIDYNAKVEDVKDNMKSILEKVTINDQTVKAEEKEQSCILKGIMLSVQ